MTVVSCSRTQLGATKIKPKTTRLSNALPICHCTSLTENVASFSFRALQISIVLRMSSLIVVLTSIDDYSLYPVGVPHYTTPQDDVVLVDRYNVIRLVRLLTEIYKTGFYEKFLWLIASESIIFRHKCRDGATQQQLPKYLLSMVILPIPLIQEEHQSVRGETNELSHGKTNNLHMRKQRRRSAWR